MTNLRIPLCAVWLTLFCGCSDRLDYIRYDNPVVRGLQAEQLGRFLPEGAKRTSTMRHFAPRVGFIVLGDPNRPTVGSGRAAAVSRDGYYLTAAHVIAKKPFYLSETTVSDTIFDTAGAITQEELEELIQTRSYLGRVVWTNPDYDLALIKFEKKTPRYFRMESKISTVGETLYSADDSGLGMYLEVEGGGETMVGNGPFLVAGPVSAIRRQNRLPDSYLIETGIISRGGMSGAPLANRDGNLCGIILHIDVNRRHEGGTRTVAGMISPDRIRWIIAADRGKHKEYSIK